VPPNFGFPRHPGHLPHSVAQPGQNSQRIGGTYFSTGATEGLPPSPHTAIGFRHLLVRQGVFPRDASPNSALILQLVHSPQSGATQAEHSPHRAVLCTCLLEAALGPLFLTGLGFFAEETFSHLRLMQVPEVICAPCSEEDFSVQKLHSPHSSAVHPGHVPHIVLAFPPLDISTRSLHLLWGHFAGYFPAQTLQFPHGSAKHPSHLPHLFFIALFGFDLTGLISFLKAFANIFLQIFLSHIPGTTSPSDFAFFRQYAQDPHSNAAQPKHAPHPTPFSGLTVLASLIGALHRRAKHFKGFLEQ